MYLRQFVACACSIFLLFINNNAIANLLIYPVRVSFDEAERSAQLTLSNTSSRTNTYRLSWQEKRALPEGGYTDINVDEAKNLPISSSMLRFSPRQVTLKPGERQLIKLVLRRPRDLAEGEYRSHLLFKAVPPEVDKEEKSTSTSINIVLSFAVPVTIQQGGYDTRVSLKGVNVVYNTATGNRTLSLDLLRKGLHSASGDISAFWTPTGGKEVLLAKVADYNFWSELEEVRATLISTDTVFTPADGRLRILYEGVRDFRGYTYIDEVIDIKLSQIVIEK
jgi:fimbrial chaperone protein